MADQKGEPLDLQTVIDTIPALVVCTLPDGSVEFVNQGWREYTGLSAEELTGWGWQSAIHFDDRSKFIDEWRAALRAGRSVQNEARVRRADGHYQWFLIRKTPQRDPIGRIVRWYETGYDIEDRKQAEDRVRLVIDTIPTMAWSVRSDGAVDFVNQRWLDYTGLSLEEAIEGPTCTVHPEDLPNVMENWLPDLATGAPSEDEMRLRRADGTYRWFLVRTAPLRDKQGNVVKWYGSSIDIDDRKLAERELRALIDAIPQQVWSGPPDGTIDYCNDRSRSYTGLELEDLRDDGWKIILHRDDRDRVVKAWHESVVNGTPYEQEERHRGADGTYRWFLARGVPLRDAEGRIVRWYGTNTDIEDGKQAEEELRRLSGQLLRSQDEEQRRLARELHDSTAQSLAGLRLSLAVLEESVVEQHDAALDPRARNALADAIAVADRCLSEIRTIAYLLHPPMLDELGLRSALVSYVKGFIQRSGIQVDLDIAPDFGRLPRDVETTLFRIVQEALTNVHRHSRSSTASIRIRHRANEVTMSVSDSGRGVYQASKERSSPGVGIPSMRERVQQLGGRVEIQSDQNGTTVRIVIPLGMKQHV
jgi:PAS domain S-box-containing protein